MTRAISFYELPVGDDISQTVDRFISLLPSEKVSLHEEILVLKLIARDHVKEWIDARNEKQELGRAIEALITLGQAVPEALQDGYELAKAKYGSSILALRKVYRDIREMSTAASCIDKNMRETVAQGTLAYFVHSVLGLVATKYGYSQEFENELRHAITIQKSDGKASPYDIQFIEMMDSVPTSN